MILILSRQSLARDREADSSYKVLRHLLIVDGTGFKEGDNEEVTLERFGRMIKWFGNLNNDHGTIPCRRTCVVAVAYFDILGNILKRIVAVAQQPWFHGEMERPACETLLANIKVPPFPLPPLSSLCLLCRRFIMFYAPI